MLSAHHVCRWSECAVDDTDDEYTGDNRDGDETWYKYRTQQFCANSAFSLYGTPKRTKARRFWKKKSNNRCSKRYFIDSYFTYGGADILLKAAGIEPDVFYYNNAYTTNALCINAGSSWSSTMGCSAGGEYTIAMFSSSTCDGNYYQATTDNFTSYNEQYDSLGCKPIFDSDEGTDPISYLMSNSWACDVRLYPQECPDPYGTKAKLEVANQAKSLGKNAYRAYKALERRRPMRAASIGMAFVAFVALAMGYYMKNHKRIQGLEASAPVKGRLFKYRAISYLWCVCLDIAFVVKKLFQKFCSFMVACGVCVQTTFMKCSDEESDKDVTKSVEDDDYQSNTIIDKSSCSPYDLSCEPEEVSNKGRHMFFGLGFKRTKKSRG